MMYGTIVLMAACSSLKNKTRSETESRNAAKYATESKTDKKWQESKTVKSLFLKQDSADMAFTVEIWPIGSFDFSPQKGFAGTAQKITYRGRASQLSNTFLNQKMESSAEAKEKMELKATSERVTVDKQLDKTLEVKRSANLKWYVLAALLLIVMFVVYRIFKIIR